MLYSSNEIANLNFRSARLEMRLLCDVPAYAVPARYVEQVALRLVEVVSTPAELAAAIEAVRGWVQGRLSEAFTVTFWDAVGAKSFAPADRAWTLAL